MLKPGQRPGKHAQVQAIGETKLTADTDALAHLDRRAELLDVRGHGRPRRLFIVAETVSSALRTAVGRRGDVELFDLDLDRLYHVD